jgi:hypothetical protein
MLTTATATAACLLALYQEAADVLGGLTLAMCDAGDAVLTSREPRETGNDDVEHVSVETAVPGVKKEREFTESDG